MLIIYLPRAPGSKAGAGETGGATEMEITLMVDGNDNFFINFNTYHVDDNIWN